MNHAASVFRMQRKIFMRDKGMLVFYFAGIIVSGIVIPLFSRSPVTSFTMAAFFTTMWLKPMLAESLAGEREKKTLESLLSTSIKGKSVLWGKMLFNLWFALVNFGVTAGCAALTYTFAGYEAEFGLWQWLYVVGMAVLAFTAVSIAGTYFSATSADLRTANGRVSVTAYLPGLLLIIFITVVSLNQTTVTLIIGGIAAFYLCFFIVFCVKASVMKQQKYYENIKVRKAKRAKNTGLSAVAPKSQFETVLRHELRYLKTIKAQKRQFVLLCTATVLCAWLMKFIEVEVLGLAYLDFTVLLTLFGVPSAVRNMVSYSIGGERAYKTGESLLATPLNVKIVFLAKCAMPIIIAMAMIAMISLLSLTGANIIGRLMGSGVIELYSPTQFMLLYIGGILACIAMILISGILSVMMKTPRSGLYVSTLLQLVLFIPPSMIIYLAPANAFMWTAIYAGGLLLINIFILARISGNIRRPWLMNRL